jgi:hypothetical protein
MFLKRTISGLNGKMATAQTFKRNLHKRFMISLIEKGMKSRIENFKPVTRDSESI